MPAAPKAYLVVRNGEFVGTRHPLGDEDRDTLVRWIEQGAEVEPHWAYVAPRRSADNDWARAPIDAALSAAMRAASAGHHRRRENGRRGKPKKPSARGHRSSTSDIPQRYGQKPLARGISAEPSHPLRGITVAV